MKLTANGVTIPWTKKLKVTIDVDPDDEVVDQVIIYVRGGKLTIRSPDQEKTPERIKGAVSVVAENKGCLVIGTIGPIVIESLDRHISSYF